MRKGAGLLIVAACVVSSCSASAAFAEEAAAPSFETVERVTLYLDWGFVGRPVSLDLFGDRIHVGWDAGDLTAPTILLVERERLVSSPDGVGIGEDVAHLTWADPNHLSERGVSVRVGDCVPDAWTTCTSFRLDGTSWREMADGRAYGHARVRGGERRLAYM
ncbi:hypothetical protein L0Y59_03690, partial [Candidatus Uhrbacteria bacterium]|nr:hypothetical protein [Candidatus Uhrbacteria bacterium]